MKDLSKIFLNLDAHCAWMDFHTVFEIVYRNTTQYQFLKVVFRK